MAISFSFWDRRKPGSLLLPGTWISASEGSQMLVSTRDISELPLAEVNNFKTGESGGAGRMVTAWRLLVLCALLDVILEDQSSAVNRDPDVLRVVKELRAYGFIGSDTHPERFSQPVNRH